MRTCVKEGAVEIKYHGGDLVRRGGHGSTLGEGAESMGGTGRRRGRFMCTRRKRPKGWESPNRGETQFAKGTRGAFPGSGSRTGCCWSVLPCWT